MCTLADNTRANAALVDSRGARRSQLGAVAQCAIAQQQVMQQHTAADTQPVEHVQHTNKKQ
jgi:hypothetical protein